jgi:hypothetical protein
MPVCSAMRRIHLSLLMLMVRPLMMGSILVAIQPL